MRTEPTRWPCPEVTLPTYRFAPWTFGQHCRVVQQRVDQTVSRITYAEASALLDCHVSNIPKLIARGQLTVHREPGRVRGHLLRTDVLQLAEVRAAAAAAPKVYVRPKKVDRRPDADHDWLTPAQAGRVVAITAMGIHQRIRRERLPAVKNQGRWWVRRDLLEQVEAARLAVRTRTPDGRVCCTIR